MLDTCGLHLTTDALMEGEQGGGGGRCGRQQQLVRQAGDNCGSARLLPHADTGAAMKGRSAGKGANDL